MRKPPDLHWKDVARDFRNLLQGSDDKLLSGYGETTFRAATLLQTFVDTNSVPAVLQPAASKWRGLRCALATYESRLGRQVRQAFEQDMGVLSIEPTPKPPPPPGNPALLIDVIWCAAAETLRTEYPDCFPAGDEPSPPPYMDPLPEDLRRSFFLDKLRYRCTMYACAADLIAGLLVEAQSVVDLKKQTLDTRACGALVAHPGWTDTQIAAHLRCNRTSLYRLRGFMRARGLQKESKKDNLRPGHWDAERGQAVPGVEDEDGWEASED